jgi:hypothetical protein
MYHNIERSGFRRGEYVGYAHGVWHIRRINGRQLWEAIFPCIRIADYRPAIVAQTLRELSTRLDAYQPTVSQ